TITTRSVPEYPAQGARAGIDLSCQRDQAPGPDRVLRPVRRAPQEHRDANGVQARHLHRRAFACGQSVGRPFLSRELIRTRYRLRPGAMAERSSGRNAAVLVGLDFGAGGYDEGIEELGQLAASAGIRGRALVRGRRGRTHLQRQRGGKGFLGGMGETQLEVDRRLIANRVKILKDKLGKLGRRREVQRRARERGRAFSVSLVGYTNAGKSTLFNTLTHAGALAEDRLFAT